ncbi:hypothetical protein [Dietzia lutea]|uniref:hypothetical protein n=1 Tax=Dietzia lutea TaxID=546160 RepID=UPI0013303E33|nr:hypothetical protein [Dietzia lutea]
MVRGPVEQLILGGAGDLDVRSSVDQFASAGGGPWKWQGWVTVMNGATDRQGKPVARHRQSKASGAATHDQLGRLPEVNDEMGAMPRYLRARTGNWP